MAKKQIAGVSGVLGSLISDSTPTPDKQADSTAPSIPHKSAPSSTSGRKLRARLGRPPGKSEGTPAEKEKLTVRIDARLATAYRDWSWEARCQLGELVERALQEYLAHRRP